MFKDLNPILHSQLRLSIVSILMSVDEANFNFIKDETQATSGNISIQIKKLQDAGYIKVKKTFKNNYPNTSLSITKKGIEAFENYVNNLKSPWPRWRKIRSPAVSSVESMMSLSQKYNGDNVSNWAPTLSSP